MKQFIIIISVCLILSSCCGTHSEITYSYSGSTIKRIDECGISNFYFKGESEPFVYVEYSGINDGFGAYFEFNKSTLTLLSGDGHFIVNESDTTIFNHKRIGAYQRPKVTGSVCYISYPLTKERRENSNTDVLIEYEIDDNDWW
ncbi:hypothetical protein [Ekhidna sp.]|uniref:hypothetical protein n=1 Tax=Ekhidna sp. TaxID=2608089 RepID=UPI0032998AE9